MYHGTSKNFDSFKNSFKAVTTNDVNMQPIFFTSNPDFADSYANQLNGSVLAVFLNVKKPFSYNNLSKNEIIDYENYIYNQFASKYNNDKLDEIVYQWMYQFRIGSWGILEDPLTISYAKQNGFDAIITIETKDRNIGVFSPSQIKSATGNNGDYNSNNSNILSEEENEEFYFDPTTVPENKWKHIALNLDRMGYSKRPYTDWKNYFLNLGARNLNNEEHIKAIKDAFKENTPRTDDQKIITKAKRFFGLTNNYNEAGYLLIDGSMLDFSGRKFGNRGYNRRDMDHREINNIGIDMVEFMALGNIRMQSYGIELTQMPTKQQINTLKYFFGQVKDEIIIDFSEKGKYHTLFNVLYPKGTNIIRILNDIIDYYKKGIKPVPKPINENKIIEEFIPETNELFGYHVTSPNNLENIEKNGLKVGQREMQGKGLYAFYDYEHAVRYATKGSEGGTAIVIFKIKYPTGFIYLNMNIAKQVLGEKYHLSDQVEHYFRYNGGMNYFLEQVKLAYDRNMTMDNLLKTFNEIETDNSESNQRKFVFNLIPFDLNNKLDIVWNGNYGLEYRINSLYLIDKPLGYIKYMDYGTKTITKFTSKIDALHNEINTNERYIDLRTLRINDVDELKPLLFRFEEKQNSVKNNKEFNDYQNFIDLLKELIKKFS